MTELTGSRWLGYVTAAPTAFLAATLAGAVLTPVVRTAARRYGVLDHALTARKIHGKPIPRLGGIAIVLAFYAPLFALLFVNSEVGRRFTAEPHKAFGLFAGGLAIAGLGVWDDLAGCTARSKFAIQFGVAIAIYYLGFRIDRLANPWGPPLPLGWLALPFTVLWIAGVINAMNLIDGLDGLAGGVALIAIATTAGIALIHAQPLMLLFCGALGGAVLGFLFYNFNPASIFMGDTGSMFLGFVLATTSIQTNQKSSTAVAIIVPIIALGVPIADTLLAMARRAARGVPMFSADRGHIHHRLLDSGLTHRQTVLVIYGASTVLGTVALVLSSATSRQTTAYLIAVSVASFFALRRLGFISLRKVQKVVVDRRRNLRLRRKIRRIGESLRAATRIQDVWAGVRVAARVIGASAVELHLPEEGPAESELSVGFDQAAPDELFRARYGLVPERIGDTHVEFGWTDGRVSVDRDTEIAIELLCDHLSVALDRIGREQEPDEDGLAHVVNLRR